MRHKLNVKEISTNVVSFPQLKGLNIRYFYYIARQGNRRKPGASRSYIPSINFSAFAKGKPFTLYATAITNKGRFTASNVWINKGKKDTSKSSKIFEKYESLISYHDKQYNKHRLGEEKAKNEARDIAEVEHREAKKAHNKVSFELKKALRNKDDGAYKGIVSLIKEAELETKQALEADDIRNEVNQNPSWSKNKGLWELEAISWDNSNRNIPLMRKAGNSFGFIFPWCGEKVLKLEYITDKTKKWTNIFAFQHLAYMVGHNWSNFNLTLRINGNDNNKVKFFIPPLPIEINRNATIARALEELKKRQTSKAKASLEKVLEDIKEEENLKENLKNEIAKTGKKVSGEEMWEAMKPILPPTFYQALREKLTPKGTDSEHTVPTLEVFKQVGALCPVSTYQYKNETYDCDDYSMDARVWFTREFGLNCLAWVYDAHKTRGSRHSYNIAFILNEKGKVEAHVYEPQRNRLIPKNEIHKGNFKMSGADIYI